MFISIIYHYYIYYIWLAMQKASWECWLVEGDCFFCWVRDGIGAVKRYVRLKEPWQKSRNICWLIRGMLSSELCMPQCCVARKTYCWFVYCLLQLCLWQAEHFAQRNSKQGNKSAAVHAVQDAKWPQHYTPSVLDFVQHQWWQSEAAAATSTPAACT